MNKQNEFISTPKEPLSSGEVEGMYEIGKQLYEQKKFKDSRKIFQVIAILKPEVSKYVRALAATFQATGENMRAIELYTAAYFSDPLDLRCIYNMSQCMLLDGKVQDAIEMLEILMTCKDREDYKHREVINEAALVLVNLKEEENNE